MNTRKYQREYMRNWRKKNPARLKQMNQEYYQKRKRMKDIEGQKPRKINKLTSEQRERLGRNDENRGHNYAYYLKIEQERK